MRKLSAILLVSALFSIQTAVAEEAPAAAMQPAQASQDGSNIPPGARPCSKVAKACIAGGYAKHKGRLDNFYLQCMKPLLLGKAVKDVTLDAAIIKACREDKIAEMKKELVELQSVS